MGQDCRSGVTFEDLPATWRCPICGVSKSAYRLVSLPDGSAQWVEQQHFAQDLPANQKPTETKKNFLNADVPVALAPTSQSEQCSVCGHVYDPLKDCGGMGNPTQECGSGV